MFDVKEKCQAVFYVGLSQQLLPILEKSTNYGYASTAIDLCWQWIEQQNVDAQALFSLYHDEDDHGVESVMEMVYEPTKWNAWGCISGALLYTASCAYIHEKKPLPETLEDMDSDEVQSFFINCYSSVTGESQVPKLFYEFLQQASDEEVTESNIRTKLAEFALLDDPSDS